MVFDFKGAGNVVCGVLVLGDVESEIREVTFECDVDFDFGLEAFLVLVIPDSFDDLWLLFGFFSVVVLQALEAMLMLIMQIA